MAGILFDAISPEHGQTILDSLTPSINQWECRERFPYFPPDFGYEGGNYHNGGIWPYLNHVHAWALLKSGRRDEAIGLLKRVARADPVESGDYIPHEFIHGVPGKQAGVPMQGWNAAMFGTCWFGLKQNEVP